MSLADYPNQFAVFCHNSFTKLMVDKRVWRIKRWRINENSLYSTQDASSSTVFSLPCGSRHVYLAHVLTGECPTETMLQTIPPACRESQNLTVH